MSHIRWMIRPDMSQVLNIDGLVCPDYWDEEEYLRVLRQRNCIGMVIERPLIEQMPNETLAGFMVYELAKKYLRLLRLVVHPAYMRASYGTAMIDKLKHKLAYQRRNRILCDVPDNKLEFQLFLREQQFRAYGIINHDGQDSDYQFRYKLPKPTIVEVV